MLSGRKNGAFTLIELLIVISIIALMMGVLLPALQRARGQARGMFCLSILRNLSLAHKAYQAETGKYLPHTSYEYVDGKRKMRPWYLNDYLRRSLGLPLLSPEQKKRRSEIQEWKPNVPRKFICPSATYALKHPEDGLYPIDRSYGVNIDGDYYARKKGVSDLYDKGDWVRHPSAKLFMADALDWWIGFAFCEGYFEYGEDWIGFGTDGETDGGTYGMTAFRHYDSVNLMYWDGHCGRLPSDEVVNNPDLWDPLK